MPRRPWASDKMTVPYSIYDALVDNVPVEQVVMLTKRVSLDLVPAAAALAGAEVELVDAPDREHLLTAHPPADRRAL